MSTSSAVTTFGLLAPMPSELRPVRRALALRPGHRDPSFLHGRSGADRIVAAQADIGPARAAAATERLLDAFAVDHVVVVGIAGAVDPRLAIGELVVPEVVVDWRTDRELRPAVLGSERPRGTLLTADVLLHEPATLRELRTRGVVAVDMETAAVGAVCERRGVRWSIFRAVSDRAEEGHLLAEGILQMIDAEGRARPGAVVRYLATHPHRVPHLAKLARGSRHAAQRAARAAATAVRAPAA